MKIPHAATKTQGSPIYKCFFKADYRRSRGKAASSVGPLTSGLLGLQAACLCHSVRAPVGSQQLPTPAVRAALGRVCDTRQAWLGVWLAMCVQHYRWVHVWNSAQLRAVVAGKGWQVCVTALTPLCTRESPGLQADLGQKRSSLSQILQPQVPSPSPGASWQCGWWRGLPLQGPWPAKALLLVWDWGPSPDALPGPRPERMSCLNRLSTPSWQPPNLAPSLLHTAHSATWRAPCPAAFGVRKERKWGGSLATMGHPASDGWCRLVWRG